MKVKLTDWVCLIAVCSLIAIKSAYAATLVVDGSGNLLGANGVDVPGVGTFNVIFDNGTCISLFDGCNDAGDFAFSSQTDAETAALALLNSVFLDVAEGQFDSDPPLTNGCSFLTVCDAVIPYGNTSSPPDSVLVIFTINGDGDTFTDDILSTSIDRSSDLSDHSNATWAVFSPVPIPAAVWLFGSGLIGLIGIAKRKKALSSY